MKSDRCYCCALYLRIKFLDLIPDSFKFSSFHPPSDEADVCNTEQVSFLSETDQTIPAYFMLFAPLDPTLATLHHSSGPSPVASIPADSDTKMGMLYRAQNHKRSRNHCFVRACIKMHGVHDIGNIF
jgi:hypothetical protein